MKLQFATRSSILALYGMLMLASPASAFDLLGTLKEVATQNAGNIAKEVASESIRNAAVKEDAAQSAETVAEEAPASKSLAVTAINPEDLISYSNTVVVPTAYVKLLVEGSAFVSQKGGYQIGKSANAVNASAKYKVVGIDKKLAQDIARQAYDDFVAKLRAAGYTVLTYNDIRDRDFVMSAEREKADANWGLPVENSRAGDQIYIVAAPSDEQHFMSGMNSGVFNQFVSLGKPKFKDATVIIPQYTITAPQVWGKADASYSTISAAINTAPGMQLQSATAPWMGAPVVRIMHGIPGLTTKGAIKISDKVGELVKAADEPTAASTTANVLNAGLQGLALLTGAGTIKQNASEYTFTIDRNAYASAALRGAGDFNARMAEVAAAAKK
ncbi:MAG: hypothetical protein EPN14_09995 [Gallionella sp.]|nr:MAG: hypothetical protein EPN14_09995 [Gallionella sp.]